MLENNIRIMKQEENRIESQKAQEVVRLKEYKDKVEQQRVLPYLVASVVEIIEVDRDSETDAEGRKLSPKMKCVVVKTTTRQVTWLSHITDSLPASCRSG